jgi:hypothetical protein
MRLLLVLALLPFSLHAQLPSNIVAHKILSITVFEDTLIGSTERSKKRMIESTTYTPSGKQMQHNDFGIGIRWSTRYDNKNRILSEVTEYQNEAGDWYWNDSIHYEYTENLLTKTAYTADVYEERKYNSYGRIPNLDSATNIQYTSKITFDSQNRPRTKEGISRYGIDSCLWAYRNGKIYQKEKAGLGQENQYRILIFDSLEHLLSSIMYIRDEEHPTLFTKQRDSIICQYDDRFKLLEEIHYAPYDEETEQTDWRKTIDWSEVYTYDASGSLIEQKRFETELYQTAWRGVTTFITFRYDTNGQITEEVYSDGERHVIARYTYEYNAQGDVLVCNKYAPTGALLVRQEYVYVYGK